MKRRIFLIGGTIVIVVLLGVLSAIALFQSDNFRGWLSRKVSHSLGATAGQFGRLTWKGTTFNSEDFHAVGGPKSKLISVHAKNISAHLRWFDLLLGRVIFDQLTVDQVDVELGRKPRPVNPPASPPRFRWASWNIDFRITSLLIRRLDLHWSKDEHIQGTLSGSQVNAKQNGAGVWTVKVMGGELSHPAFLPANLVAATGEVSRQSVQIQDATFRAGPGGIVHLRGSIAVPGPPLAHLHAEFANVSLNAISPRSTGQDGIASGRADYSGDLDRFERGQATGGLQITNLKLDLSGFFGKFQSFVKAGGFAEIPLDQLTAKIQYADQIVTISELQARHDDQIRVTGSGTIRGEDLAGVLLVGVAPDFLSSIPGATEKVFLEQRDGLRWTWVNVSGTLRQPREDLSKRLVTAIRGALSNDLKQNAREAAKTLLDRLFH